MGGSLTSSYHPLRTFKNAQDFYLQDRLARFTRAASVGGHVLIAQHI